MVAGVRHPRSCKAAQVEISQMSELGLTRGTSCPLLGEGEGCSLEDVRVVHVHRKVCRQVCARKAHSLVCAREGRDVPGVHGVEFVSTLPTRLHTDLCAGRRRLQQEIAQDQHQLELLLLLAHFKILSFSLLLRFLLFRF